MLSGDPISLKENMALYLSKRLSFSSIRIFSSSWRLFNDEGGAGSTDPYIFSILASFLGNKSLPNANWHVSASSWTGSFLYSSRIGMTSCFPIAPRASAKIQKLSLF